jgi:hypothetical protein
MDKEREAELPHAKKLTPREFAYLRSKQTSTIVSPQRVYYYIRRERLKLEYCDCGRKVLDVQAATELFDSIDGG